MTGTKKKLNFGKNGIVPPFIYIYIYIYIYMMLACDTFQMVLCYTMIICYRLQTSVVRYVHL